MVICDMETVAKFVKGEDAYLFRSFLNSEGIEAHVFDEYIAQLFWHYTQAIGGVRVAVADEDYDEARKLFTEYSGKLNQEPVFTEEVRAWPLVIIMSVLAGFPLIFFGKKFIGRDDGNP
jgi:hypothetical protein